jgi:hypothetical protein
MSEDTLDPIAEEVETATETVAENPEGAEAQEAPAAAEDSTPAEVAPEEVAE